MHNTYDDFLDRIKKDNIKTNYCIKNNIKLYRIKYDKIKDVKEWIEENKSLFEQGGG